MIVDVADELVLPSAFERQEHLARLPRCQTFDLIDQAAVCVKDLHLVIEFTDVLFAVDSVPAVLAVSREQFIVFASNAFAILGLRALYFLLADAHARFSFLKEGLAIILAFVGVKMLIAEWYHIPTWLSLVVIVIVLSAAIGFSLKADRSSSNDGDASRH